MSILYNNVFIEHPATAIASVNVGCVTVKLAFSLEKPVLHARFRSLGGKVVIEVPENTTSVFKEALNKTPVYLRRKLNPAVRGVEDLSGYSMNKLDYISTVTAGLVCISSKTPFPVESVLSASNPEALISYRSMVMGGLSMYAVLGRITSTPVYHTPPPPNTEVVLCRGDASSRAIDNGGGIEALRAALSLAWEGRVSEAVEALRAASRAITISGEVGVKVAEKKVLLIPLEESGWYVAILFKEDACNENALSYNSNILDVIESLHFEANVTRLSMGGVVRVS